MSAPKPIVTRNERKPPCPAPVHPTVSRSTAPSRSSLGANRGFGRAMVKELLDRGAAKVYATSRSPQQQGGQRVIPLVLDDIRAELETNLFGVICVARAVEPVLARHESRAMVNRPVGAVAAFVWYGLRHFQSRRVVSDQLDARAAARIGHDSDRASVARGDRRPPSAPTPCQQACRRTVKRGPRSALTGSLPAVAVWREL